jgi:sirohydrochlorin cobaltochelatase
MFTPGGAHSEIEIPEILQQLRKQYPDIVLRYAWPFDLSMVAKLLQEQVARFS